MSADVTAAQPRIVLGVDGSEQSKLALRWAASMATVTDASIDVVAVWHFPTAYGWNPEQDTKKWLVEAADEVFGSERPSDLRHAATASPRQRRLRPASPSPLSPNSPDPPA